MTLDFSINDIQYHVALRAGYQVSDQELNNPAGTTYYGYLRKDGYWFIMKSVRDGAVTTFRFAKGTTGYATNWNNRASLTYGYYDSNCPA